MIKQTTVCDFVVNGSTCRNIIESEEGGEILVSQHNKRLHICKHCWQNFIILFDCKAWTASIPLNNIDDIF